MQWVNTLCCTRHQFTDPHAGGFEGVRVLPAHSLPGPWSKRTIPAGMVEAGQMLGHPLKPTAPDDILVGQLETQRLPFAQSRLTWTEDVPVQGV